MAQAAQHYGNHAHRPWLWSVGFLLWLVAAALLGRAWRSGDVPYLAVAATLVAAFPPLLIGRVYITRLQDRVIRLEMRVRCARLLTPEQAARLERLSMKQVVALRFASDAELPALLERATREGLTPDQIKRAVVDWVPDYNRT